MKKDYLIQLIFDTNLVNSSSLSERELLALNGYLRENKSYTEISKEIGITDERVRQLIENAICKIFIAIRDFLAKASLLEAALKKNLLLDCELKKIKLKFVKELEEEQSVPARVKTIDISIDHIRLSSRAKKILVSLNIKGTKDLAILTRQALNSADKAGVKSVEEIVRVAAEYGINIT